MSLRRARPTRNRSRQAGETGRAVVVDRDPRSAAARASAGDVVVLVDSADLDPEVGRALITRGVDTLVLTGPVWSGRYPAAGPLLLARAGVGVLSDAGTRVSALRDGERVRIEDAAVVVIGDGTEIPARRRTEADLAQELADLRSAGGSLLRAEAMVADAVALLRRDPGLVDGEDADPALVAVIAGRPCVVAADPWPSDRIDLLRRASQDPGWAVIAAGERSARPLVDAGVVVDAVIVPRTASGPAPSVGPPRIRSPFASDDLSACVIPVLVAGAPAVAAVGSDSDDLAAVLEQPRATAAVAALARLVGAGRLVDTEAVTALAPPALQGRGSRRSADQVRRRRRSRLVAGGVMVALIGVLAGLGPVRTLVGADRTEDRLRVANQQLAEREQRTTEELAALDALATRLIEGAVDGRLDGRALTLVVAAGSDPQVVNGTRSVLEQAGARLLTQVTLTDRYGRDDQAGALDDLALRLAPPDADLPEDGGPRARADAALAAALLRTADREPGGSDTAAAGLLAALEQVGALTVEGEPSGGAELAVLVVPAGGSATTASVALAQSLARSAGVVVVTGSPVLPASAVAVLRGLQPPTPQLATVDGADRAPGRVAVVDAAEAALRGVFGSFGRSVSSAAVPTVSAAPTGP